MDTLEKHNNEVQDNLMELWDKYKEKLGLGEYSDEIALHIENQNTELLKKIAKGEIERLEGLKRIQNYQYEEDGKRKRREDHLFNTFNRAQLTHWQQVLQDLER